MGRRRMALVVVAVIVAVAGCGDDDARARGDASTLRDTGTSMDTGPGENEAGLDSGSTLRDSGPRPVGDGGMSLAYLPRETFEVDTFAGYVVHDPERDRDIPVLVRSPRGAPGPRPVVLFSPGGDWVPLPNGYAPYGVALARAGYVAINLSHPMASELSHCVPLGIPADECDGAHLRIAEPSEGGTLPAAWYHRPMDARAVLDDLDGIAAAAGVMIDMDRIALASHSGGSFTTMAIAGLRFDVSPTVRGVDLSDPRPRAFFAASPQGIGHLGITATSWDMIERPVMTATGREDTTESEPAAGRLDAFMHLPAPDKYQLFLDSPMANHDTLGLGGSTPAQMMLELYLGSSGAAFLDAYVRDDVDARAWLVSGSIDAWSGGVATITAR